jgi:GR25 family glycosyltransferase involved in LPS biosynthesis
MRVMFCVVNLDRSSVRLDSIQRNFEKYQVDFERVPAVDGAALADEEIDRVYEPALNRRNYFAPLKRSEVACFLSHRKAWAHFLASPADFVVVVEDDILFQMPPQDLVDQLAGVVGRDQPTLVKVYCKRPVQGRLVAELDHTYRLIHPTVAPLNCQAQMLNRAAAEKLLQSTVTFWEPVDVALQRWWDTGVRVLALQPNLVTEESGQLGGSTIQGRTKTGWLPKLRRELGRVRFRLKRRLASSYPLFRG